MASYFAILAGFALLIVGGELLVRGSVRAAEQLGVSPLLIGITLVGFGTSAPEMVISVQAAMTGSPGIAVGNFVGSCISNILLILGLSAMVAPVAVNSNALARDGSVVLLTALVFVLVSIFLPFNRIVGFTFLVALVSYLVYAWREERVAGREGHPAPFQKAEAYHLQLHRRLMSRMRAGVTHLVPTMIALAGLVVIVYGGKVLVDGAVQLARELKISEAVIGLTIVAIGTSMPELVTSLVAAFRGHTAVAVGNILGSNIFNILAVGGSTALLAPTTIPKQIVWFDNFVMLGAAVALVVFARSGNRISRLEGLGLFLGYIAYLIVLWPR
ncbi:MAG: calcium/sodium antiporter [Hyphomicrobiaceae bacterium]|nr:calcium/sodium antiporter [Hyphomicrobiaceae bacterium]